MHNIDAHIGHFGYFTGNTSHHIRLDTKIHTAHQCLATELQQYALVFSFNVGLAHIHPLFGWGAILQDIRAVP